MREQIIAKLKEKFKENGERLNYIQDKVDEARSIDKTGTDNFFITLNREYELTKGEDGSLIGGEYFDWKEFEREEVLHAMLNLLDRKINQKAREIVYDRILKE